MRSFFELSAAAVYNVKKRKAASLTRRLSKRQWWSRERLMKLSEERARALAAHAAGNVPYYKEIFRSLDVDPRRMAFPEDWEKIPVLTKDMLRENYDLLLSTAGHAAKGIRNHSGGSTGMPVSFLSDPALYDSMAASLNLGFTWAGWKQGEMIFMIWGANIQNRYDTFLQRLRARLSGNLIQSVYSYDAGSFELWLKLIGRYKPTIIYGYPSAIADFSGWMLEKGHAPKGIKGVFCSAEMLLESKRRVIEAAFGCKVYNQYGCREAPGIACECPEGNMHLFADLNMVEFPEQGVGPGRIIVTPLGNYAQPLLRYDLGDTGLQKDGACPCGRGYPLLDINLGRQNDYLVSSDGKLIYPGYFTRLLDGRHWIRLFRYRQIGANRIELLVECKPGPDINKRIEALKSEILPAIRSRIGPETMLEITPVEKIERTGAGKHRYIENAIKEKA
ncbi:MAG: hypothetical protein M0Z75_09985 [Nitrospiraceae bacterium]|nr:hypothetical protein [Nitrospiraceae bacterium]